MEDEKLFIALNFISKNNFPLIDNPKHLPKNIGFNEYLSIIEYLENKQYIESVENDAFFGLTDVGVANFNLIRENLKQQNSDKLAERKKLHNESVMSGWKRKTFWYIFALGLFGGIYSGIDLFNKIIDNKEIQKRDNQESELNEIKTISKDTLSKSTQLKNTQID